jgi:Uma2 family endonuclease
MATQPKRYISPQEYLEVERKAEFKSEYFNGEMFAMAGASADHVRIVTNISGELRQRLKGRECWAGSTELRTFIPATGMFTYPDVFIVCGEQKTLDTEFDTLLNPNVIFEVLSDSTENYDRGRKFAHYQSIVSLSDYVLVAQDKVRVERYKRQPSGDWLLSVFTSLGESIPFPELGCELPLSEIYFLVELK